MLVLIIQVSQSRNFKRLCSLCLSAKQGEQESIKSKKLRQSGNHEIDNNYVSKSRVSIKTTFYSKLCLAPKHGGNKLLVQLKFLNMKPTPPRSFLAFEKQNVCFICY